MTSENRQNWATPEYVFAALHAEYNFTIDLCAEEWNAKLPRYFTEHDNALKQSWAGENGFGNPPYDDPGIWLEKAWDEAECDAVTTWLLPVREDAAWWHKYAIFAEMHFFRGRIKYIPPPDLAAKLVAEAAAEGKKWTNNPKFGNVMLRIGKTCHLGKVFSRHATTGLYHVEL